MKETIIIILLIVLIIQSYIKLRRQSEIIEILGYLKRHLFGLGKYDGIMGKLNYLQDIHYNIDRMFKETNPKYKSYNPIIENMDRLSKK